MCLQNLLEINGNPWRNRDASTAVIRMAQQRLTCTLSQQRLFKESDQAWWHQQDDGV